MPEHALSSRGPPRSSCAIAAATTTTWRGCGEWPSTGEDGDARRRRANERRPIPSVQAADPDASAFVTANAGSGKTNTLVNRVARLLLRGARPEAILCVTYTKAAAAEMQRRLFQTLGGWAVASDEALAARWTPIDERPGDLGLSRRALFARALETPGGLKIQTIHAFCEELLRRFPLEAGVSPGFRVMEDAGRRRGGPRGARGVARARAGPGRAPWPTPIAALLRGAGLRGLRRRCSPPSRPARSHRRLCASAAARRTAWAPTSGAACGFPTARSRRRPSGGGARRASTAGLWRARGEALLQGTAKPTSRSAERLLALADGRSSPTWRSRTSAALFSTKDGEGRRRRWVAKTAALETARELREALLPNRSGLRGRAGGRCAARVAEDSADALTLAAAYAAAYAPAKAERGGLDFADLIDRVRQLLTARADAALVLYKLDGGVDHILVDEAQDTAPEPVGHRARPDLRVLRRRRRAAGTRTVFAVGDEKQSIFSFQGAAPDVCWSRQQAHQGAGARAAAESIAARTCGNPGARPPQVLKLVDAAFRTRETCRALQPREGPRRARRGVISHVAMRADHPGCVDLWPLFQTRRARTADAWDAPLDARGEATANKAPGRGGRRRDQGPDRARRRGVRQGANGGKGAGGRRGPATC